MSVLPFASERRRQRSENTYEAIKFQLEFIHESQALRNIVVADSRGLLIACAGDTEDANVLAAYAPLMARTIEKTRYLDIMERVKGFIPELREERAAFRTFNIDGEDLFICLVGKAGVMRHADLYRAVSGIRRIFGESSQAA